MKILFMLVVLLSPSLALAAYLDPEVVRSERQSSGFIKKVMEFRGNNNEPTVQREYLIRPFPTGALLAIHFRNWVYTTKRELNQLYTVSQHPNVADGQIVQELAPVASTTPAQQTWLDKVGMFKRACESGFTGAVETDCTAMKADIEATYQAGWINP